MKLSNESQTLFIPLLGKAQMSQKELFVDDPKAEEIIKNVEFDLKALKQSAYLSMYMAARAAIFDDIVNGFIQRRSNAVIVHLGCGLDSRCLRVDQSYKKWYDIDFESVITLRKKFYNIGGKYQMIGSSIADLSWIDEIIVEGAVLIVAEGVTMYLSEEELRKTLEGIATAFGCVEILFDAYSKRAVKLSKYKNPVNRVNAAVQWGMDTPLDFEKLNDGLVFCEQYPIRREEKGLKGIKKFIFNRLYCGKFRSRYIKYTVFN